MGDNLDELISYGPFPPATLASLTALLNGTYVGQDEPVYLWAGQLGNMFGGPTLGDAQWPGWLMTDSAVLFAGGSVKLPDSWTTWKLSVLWIKLTANAGDVVWRGDYDVKEVGGTAGPTAGTNRTVTASGQNVLVKTQLETNIAYTDGALVSVKGGRIGTDGADTLTGNVGLLAFVLEKVS
jgi:hypothetical protein